MMTVFFQTGPRIPAFWLFEPYIAWIRTGHRSQAQKGDVKCSCERISSVSLDSRSVGSLFLLKECVLLCRTGSHGWHE